MSAAETTSLLEISDFGGTDADTDRLLRDCFQDHPAYTAARNHERFLILGRKGSGKTAIFKRFVTERSPAAFSFGHTFDDYPWEYHDLQASVGVPEERRYFHSWRYLILMSLSKLLLNVDQSQPWDEAAVEPLENLESFVVDSYGSRDPDLTQLFQPKKTLRFKGGLRLSIASLEAESVAVEHLPLHVQEVNRSIQAAVLAALNPEHDYYVCFDQLDRDFSKTEPKYAQRLIGLLLAASDIWTVARSQGKRLSPIVFLRDDIYAGLQFEDKNKLTENHVTTVEWNREGGELTLKDLMERRFGEVLSDEDVLPWNEVFDEAKEMPSRQTKYAHICDRTFLRPRDMIKFCNEVLKTYKTLDSDGRANKFDNASVHGARDEYSTYLLRELDDEIAKHVPNYKEYLEVLKTIGKLQFSATEFAQAWRNRPDLATQDPTAGLERLFEFSVIGYLKPGGGGGGSTYVWRFMDTGARFAPGVDTWRVHAGFKEALDLISRSGVTAT